MIGPSKSTVIGGYLGLESHSRNGLDWIPEAHAFASARMALAAVVAHSRPARIWIPHHVCSAVVDAIAWCGVEICRYPLTEQWGVPAQVELSDDDLLLCVDYFGLNGSAVDEAVGHYGKNATLVDASQSLFRKPVLGETTIFSPRKFVGVPDGGLVLTTMDLAEVEPENPHESINRCMHLLLRASGKVTEGYSAFLAAESSLRTCKPAGMSGLTRLMLDNVDFERVASQRVANYRLLQETLSSQGFKLRPLPPASIPLCFPVFDVDAPKIRKHLIQRGIFTPTYWSECEPPASDPVARSLRDRTVYLPCDQRYGAPEMARLVDNLLGLEES